jgi:hypothetical protein
MSAQSRFSDQVISRKQGRRTIPHDNRGVVPGAERTEYPVVQVDDTIIFGGNEDVCGGLRILRILSRKEVIQVFVDVGVRDIRPSPLAGEIAEVLGGQWRRCTGQWAMLIPERYSTRQKEFHGRREVYLVGVKSQLGSIFLR